MVGGGSIVGPAWLATILGHRSDDALARRALGGRGRAVDSIRLRDGAALGALGVGVRAHRTERLHAACCRSHAACCMLPHFACCLSCCGLRGACYLGVAAIAADGGVAAKVGAREEVWRERSRWALERRGDGKRRRERRSHVPAAAELCGTVGFALCAVNLRAASCAILRAASAAGRDAMRAVAYWIAYCNRISAFPSARGRKACEKECQRKAQCHISNKEAARKRLQSGHAIAAF